MHALWTLLAFCSVVAAVVLSAVAPAILFVSTKLMDRDFSLSGVNTGIVPVEGAFYQNQRKKVKLAILGT